MDITKMQVETLSLWLLRVANPFYRDHKDFPLNSPTLGMATTDLHSNWEGGRRGNGGKEGKGR